MNFFWAAVYSAYKVIGHDLPVGAIVTLRFGLAGLCLLFAWPWLPGSAPRGRDLALTGCMGVILFVVGQRLQVYGNYLGRAGDSAVLMAFEPLVTSVVAAIFLHEHIGPRRWIGFGLGLSGVALLHGFGERISNGRAWAPAWFSFRPFCAKRFIPLWESRLSFGGA